ncbi:hypothetical protein BHU72_08180 [Desulfuribacillus stibiiarsenatis]|uniref:Pseudouridine synthase n=1 Tax=Desulfuribacillus stibiiarsenatis TaxID=1390249 RepID=A0A1E5L472_9FIRM|nr:hypothetical protein BHU72_08180 [Desulfuribacillus stibiiarsenatis]
MHMKGKWLTFVLTDEDAGQSLEQILKDKMSLSGRSIQRLTRMKGIFVNQKKAFLEKKLKTHDEIKVRVEESNPNIPIFNRTIEVMYEDEWILVINKAPDLKVYPTHANDVQTLANAIQFYYQSQKRQAGIHLVHRLDTGTSGAIMVAKNSYAHQLFDKELKNNRISRTYIAIIEGAIQEEVDTINLPIDRCPTHQTKRCVSKNGEEAITHYQCLGKTKDYSIVKIQIETGRTHQIRVHFAHLGHPVAGDRLYGSTNRNITRQALHAYQLQWTHPIDDRKQCISAKIPADIQKLAQHIEMTEILERLE